MKYQLTVINKRGTSVYPLEKEEILIGRSSKSDIPIKDRYISRRHITLNRAGEDCYSVTDLSAKNQVLINDKQILLNSSSFLKDGDKIIIGESLLIFSSAITQESDTSSVNLSVELCSPLACGADKIVISIGKIPELISHSKGLPELAGTLKSKFSKASFWMISLVIHLAVLGVLIWLYAFDESVIRKTPTGINLVSNLSALPKMQETNSSSILDKLISNEPVKAEVSEDNQDAETWTEVEFSEGNPGRFGVISKPDSKIGGKANPASAKVKPETPGIGGKGSKSLPVISSILLTGERAAGKGSKILTLKWEYNFLTTYGVQLYQPSGWGHGDKSVESAPWLISSPAILQEANKVFIVSGTEEGSGEFNPSRANTKSYGRYLCVSQKGEYQWEYKTENNAGRASPAIFDYNGNTGILGGSTSGWMTHFFNNRGVRMWRFASESKSNFIASPLSITIDDKTPLIVSLDLEGQLYGLSYTGSKIWSKKISSFPAVVTPLIYDVDNDGNPELIAIGNKGAYPDSYCVIQCLNLFDGEAKWTKEIHIPVNQSNWYFQISSPAILPDSKPKIIISVGNKICALSGQSGRIEWTETAKDYIYSSPAVGDCDGDGAFEVIACSLDGNIYCVNGSTGKYKWILPAGGKIYTSPALVTKNRIAPYQVEWGMFRNSSQRCGYYDKGSLSGLDIVIGSDDGWIHLIDGKSGIFIDKFPVKFPNLTVAGKSQGILKFISSPIVADIDGDRKLDIIFNLVDRMVCITDNRR